MIGIISLLLRKGLPQPTSLPQLFYWQPVQLFYLIGTIRLKYILCLLSVVILGGTLFLYTGFGRGETFKGRVEFYLTEDNSKGYGDQIILAKAAIARSGFKPTGPGQGVIKNALPEKETDYVYATVFEETGILVGFGFYSVTSSYLLEPGKFPETMREPLQNFWPLVLAFGFRAKVWCTLR